MGKRISKTYTRTGDQGSTGLGDNSRLAKTHPRVDAIGDVDELNSTIGVLLASLTADSKVYSKLHTIQHRLFDLGGELSIPGSRILDDSSITAIEEDIDQFNASLEPLEEFILPGGCMAAANCHFARAVCRRVERSLWKLAGSGEEINPASTVYLNRLSDLLFVMARVINKENGADEVYWQRDT